MLTRILILTVLALCPSWASAQTLTITYPEQPAHVATEPRAGAEFPWNVTLSPYAALTAAQDAGPLLRAPLNRRIQITVSSSEPLTGTVEATVGAETVVTPVDIAGPGDVTTGLFQAVTAVTTAPASVRFCNGAGCGPSLDFQIRFEDAPGRPSNPRLSLAVAAILRWAADEIDSAQ